MPIWFDTQEELDQAVADLAAMPAAARKLLAEIVEHQSKSVTKVSASALTLENNGFIHIRGQNGYDTSARYDSALWGEEALDVLETRVEAAKAKKKGK